MSGYFTKLPRGHPKYDAAADEFFPAPPAAAAAPARPPSPPPPADPAPPRKKRGTYRKYDPTVLLELVKAKVENRDATFDCVEDSIEAELERRWVEVEPLLGTP